MICGKACFQSVMQGWRVVDSESGDKNRELHGIYKISVRKAIGGNTNQRNGKWTPENIYKVKLLL